MVVMSLRLSYWQWERHQDKKAYIVKLEERLNEPPTPFSAILSAENPDWLDLIHRRVLIEGTYDYKHEMVLRNRRHEGIAGVFVLTPLRIKGTDKTILVNRGFAPLSYSEPSERATLSRPESASFLGLIKAPTFQKMFAPKDPQSGTELPWVDAWLRMDVAGMQRQIPYPLLPVTIEIMSTDTTKATTAAIVQGKSERDEMFVPSERMYAMVQVPTNLDPSSYPIPVFDTVIPPGRHLGYVFEWAIIALLSILISLVLQLKPPRGFRNTASTMS